MNGLYVTKKNTCAYLMNCKASRIPIAQNVSETHLNRSYLEILVSLDNIIIM